MSRRAIFLDKDGTLVDNVPYNVDPERICLAPGVDDLAKLQGFTFYVVSNQPGIALGKFSTEALASSLDHLKNQAKSRGLHLSGVLYCPHAPDAGCACRKPADGLLRRAAAEHGVALAESWMVGDILDDVEAGRRAGCRTALILNGNETEWQRGPRRVPDVVAADLGEAARLILEARA